MTSFMNGPKFTSTMSPQTENISATDSIVGFSIGRLSATTVLDGVVSSYSGKDSNLRTLVWTSLHSSLSDFLSMAQATWRQSLVRCLTLLKEEMSLRETNPSLLRFTCFNKNLSLLMFASEKQNSTLEKKKIFYVNSFGQFKFNKTQTVVLIDSILTFFIPFLYVQTSNRPT